MAQRPKIVILQFLNLLYLYKICCIFNGFQAHWPADRQRLTCARRLLPQSTPWCGGGHHLRGVGHPELPDGERCRGAGQQSGPGQRSARGWPPLPCGCGRSVLRPIPRLLQGRSREDGGRGGEDQLHHSANNRHHWGPQGKGWEECGGGKLTFAFVEFWEG